MSKISKEAKNSNPSVYGYENAWDIPGNEGCGKDNPINKGKAKGEYPEYKVNFAKFYDADGDRRYTPCSKEFAVFWRNQERNEKREKEMNSRCFIPSKKYGFKKCLEDCNNCPFGKTQRDGYTQSLDYLESEYDLEFADNTQDSIEEKMYQQQLHEQIEALTSTRDNIDKTIVDMFEKTDVEIAKLTNTSKQVVGYRRKRLIEYLKNNLKNF